nr:hypothetical protein [uncultured Flavobacterium sp.]
MKKREIKTSVNFFYEKFELINKAIDYCFLNSWEKADSLLNITFLNKEHNCNIDFLSLKNLQRENITNIFYDSIARLDILRNIISNLETNNLLIYEDFSIPHGEFFSLNYFLDYQTRELVSNHSSMSKKYEIIIKILKLRKEIELHRISALSNQSIFISERIKWLIEKNVVSILNNITILEPDQHYSLNNLDQSIEGLILKTVSEFPITAGAVPEGLYHHPYARGKHPSQSIVSNFYKNAYTPIGPNKQILTKSETVIGSSYMGIFHSLLASLQQDLLPKADLVIFIKSNKTYFEVKKIISHYAKKLFGYTESGTPRITLIEEDNIEIGLAKADIFYIDSIHNGDTNSIEYLDSLLILSKKHMNIKAVIIDITLDPFLELFQKKIKPADHQIIILLNSLTKFAQSGLNNTIGGIAVLLENKQGREKNIKAHMNDILNLLGAHMDPRLAVSIQSNHCTSWNYLKRIKRNATILSAWLQESLLNVEVIHAKKDNISSPLIFLKIENNSLDPMIDTNHHTEILKARSQSLKQSKDQGKYYANYILLYLHNWFSEHGSGRTMVRFGTSFGFNRTSIMAIDIPNKNYIYLRISPGIEDFENLLWISYGIISLSKNIRT